MNFFVGVDIENIDRFEKVDESFLNKIYTKEEIKYCLSKKKSSQHLAVRFAGKEAVIKAFSSFKEKLGFNQIEILNNEENIPIVKVDGYNKYNIKISLSHNNGNAIAFAIVLRG